MHHRFFAWVRPRSVRVRGLAKSVQLQFNARCESAIQAALTWATEQSWGARIGGSQASRRWSSPPKREDAVLGFRGWHEAGRLPHRDEPGLTQFVTFRLADSFPESLRSEWEHLWKIENDRERRTELEAYLDKGRGECHLRKPEIAVLVENAVRLFHGTRYELRAWVVMSNHVHALFKVDDVPMSEIVESWKKYTAGKANRLLKRRGSFWAAG